MTNTQQIILASGSQARKDMLRNAGVDFQAIAAQIDEKAIIKQHLTANFDICSITTHLATDKALRVSSEKPDQLVIGSDQTLEFDGKILSKANSIEEAKEKLKRLRGKTHKLHSAVSIVENETVIFSHSDHASLTMHDFDDVFLDHYMKKDPDALTSCVGGYKIEGAGAWLFSSVKGDLFTIMGMPLLPLISFLRTEYKFLP